MKRGWKLKGTLVERTGGGERGDGPNGRRKEGASERDNEEGVSRGNLMAGRKRNAGRGHRSVTAGRELREESLTVGNVQGGTGNPPYPQQILLACPV